MINILLNKLFDTGHCFGAVASPETQIVAYPLYGSGEAASKNIKMMKKSLIKAVVVWLNECLK